MGGVPIVDRFGDCNFMEVATFTSRAEADVLLKSHFKDVTPRLQALEAHHCRTARTDVADSNPARRFFEGGSP